MHKLRAISYWFPMVYRTNINIIMWYKPTGFIALLTHPIHRRFCYHQGQRVVIKIPNLLVLCTFHNSGRLIDNVGYKGCNRHIWGHRNGLGDDGFPFRSMIREVLVVIILLVSGGVRRFSSIQSAIMCSSLE